MKRLLATAFYIALSIAGLNFFAVAGVIGIQAARGKFTADDAGNILRVLGGQQRYVIPSDAYGRFRTFLEDEKAAHGELDQYRGPPNVRVPTALEAAEQIRTLEESLANYKKLLEDEKGRVLEVRREVEAQKAQLEALRRNLDAERARNVIVELDELTRQLRATLSAIEAENMAEYLTRMVRDPSSGGEAEAARIVRAHMQPRRRAEILDEIQDRDVVQGIIPLLESQFAGVPADAVVALFRQREMGPAEKRAHLMRMNPEQAFGVYLRLDARERDALAPFLLNPPR
jgi:hypothetical protein